MKQQCNRKTLHKIKSIIWMFWRLECIWDVLHPMLPSHALHRCEIKICHSICHSHSQDPTFGRLDHLSVWKAGMYLRCIASNAGVSCTALEYATAFAINTHQIIWVYWRLEGISAGCTAMPSDTLHRCEIKILHLTSWIVRIVRISCCNLWN